MHVVAGCGKKRKEKTTTTHTQRQTNKLPQTPPPPKTKHKTRKQNRTDTKPHHHHCHRKSNSNNSKGLLHVRCFVPKRVVGWFFFVSRQPVSNRDARRDRLGGACGTGPALVAAAPPAAAAAAAPGCCHTYGEKSDGGLIENYVACTPVQMAVQGPKTVFKVQIPNNVI